MLYPKGWLLIRSRHIDHHTVPSVPADTVQSGWASSCKSHPATGPNTLYFRKFNASTPCLGFILTQQAVA